MGLPQIPLSAIAPNEPLSIVEQVEALQEIRPLERLDASWVLGEATSWFDELVLPEGVTAEPLVSVWPEAEGGYHNALNWLLPWVGAKRGLRYAILKLFLASLSQDRATRAAERSLKKQQPGDFLVVPSRVQWLGYDINQIRAEYEPGEFGLGLLAETCRALSHAQYSRKFINSRVLCLGDELRVDGSPKRIFSPGFDCQIAGKSGFRLEVFEHSEIHHYACCPVGILPPAMI